MLFDDFYGNHISHDLLLQYMDGYKRILQIKGSSGEPNWTKMFFTSNVHRDHWYQQLYMKYPTQHQPQDCFIELDPEEKTVGAKSNPEIGNGVPEAVWHGRVRRYCIPLFKSEVVNELMDELKPLFERVIAGYESYWDNSNLRGTLSDDADEAEQEISCAIERCGEDHGSCLIIRLTLGRIAIAPSV